MASPANAIAYAANGGWDQTTVWQVDYWLEHGTAPDGLTPQAEQAINDIGGMGLSATGVTQVRSYLETGQAPADLSYVDESAQVLGAAPAATSPPGAAASTTPATGPTASQQSARAIVDDTLAEWGLSGLGDRVWGAITSGQIVPEQIDSYIRGTDEYKTRFAGMAQLQQRGRAITEAEYVSIERSYAQAARAAGLPAGFYDSPDDFSRLIGGEVSPAEFSDRLQTYTQVALNSPPEVRAELERLHGVGTGDLVAYFIDPNRALPLLRQQAQGAAISASAVRAGFGGLKAPEADRLAQLGVTDQQAQEGFGTLVNDKQLFQPLDSGEQSIGRDTQLAGTFGGDAGARRRIEDRRRRRQAEFAGGGGFAGNQGGLSGIGSST